MPYCIGTATDWVDAARKLREYANGNAEPGVTSGFTSGVQVTGGDVWTEETNGGSQPSLPGSGSATDGEVYLTGPGGGADEIHVQYRTYRSTNLYNWEINGALGFDDALLYGNQLGVSTSVYYALNNSSMNFWFFVNGRRIMALFQSGTIFTLMHMGFLRQYPTANQWPYPLFVSGSVNASTIPITTNTNAHTCLPDLCDNGGQIRFADGVWYEVSNFSGTSTHSNVRSVWPNSPPIISDPTINVSTHGSSNVLNPSAIWGSFSGTSVRLSSTFTGEKTLWPATVIFNNDSPQGIVCGEVEGLYTVFGESTLAVGDTINDGTDDYLVFSNCWRTTFDQYFALKLE